MARSMSIELWRQCSEWLTRWEILRPDHRANSPDANIAQLANTLRDGVLLCKLLAKIDDRSIDLKDVNLKPTMAQFLSLRNIELFLRSCSTFFGIRDEDLFEPLMLFDLTNFHKVLCTLSLLSLNEKVLQSHIPGFQAPKTKTKEEEVIYQSLRTVDLRPSSGMACEPSWLQFTIPCPRPEDKEEEVYDDLCYVTFSACLPELQPTLEKRDFVIKELLDTEKNYVDVLNKLRKNFIKPMMALMKPVDHETVFYKINELQDIHNSFLAELQRIHLDGNVKLGEIFMRWREKFLVYGAYCANLSKATNLLQALCDANESFNLAVIKYEKEDNNGRFKLRDVLSVPMQRILKYHLLLEKLIENTDPNHEEFNDLRRSREAMLDVASYINEAARDSEHLAVISNLQENITEWTTASEHRLVEFGKLLKDGELKVKAHDDQKTRNRYIFIFEKCILICKQLKGQQFGYRDLIHIADYHIDEVQPNRFLSLSKDARWSYHFHLVKNDNVMVYTFFVRSMELKDQMIKAITNALDNIRPQTLKHTNHAFELETFSERPIQCFHCSKYLRGLIYQGYRCQVCHKCVHKACIPYSGRCGGSTATISSSTKIPLTSHHHHRHHHHHAQHHLNHFMTGSNDGNHNAVNVGASSPLDDPHETDEERWELRSKLWFVGEMDRSVAQSELERRENGTFLVRIRPLSDDRDKYALSLKTNNTVKHMKICSTSNEVQPPFAAEDKKYYLSLSKFFSSIEELILNYQTYSLKENFERLEENTKLLWPYRQLYATAMRAFEPTAESHLTLREGQQIIIIGKEGYREGWWKGRNANKEVGFFPKANVRIDGEVKFHGSNGTNY